MLPSEVRERVMADHVRLRERMGEIERLARSVSGGAVGDVGELRERGEEMLAILREHMHWEDDYLGPALLDADAWGEERANLLEHDHGEQRQLINQLSKDLRDPTRPALLVAGSLLDFSKLLGVDMRWEEKTLLDARILRDDVVGIDVETG